MALVETHAHLYSDDDHRYPPKEKPHRPPAGTGTIQHLERMRKEVGITHVVAVQTFSFYGHDNRLLVDTVAEHRDWMVGVCNRPSEGADSPERLAELVEVGIRGFRLEYPKTGGPFYHPGAVAICEKARELGVVINVHANGTAHFPDVARLLTEFPEVSFCLDHCGYLKPDEPELLAGVIELARYSNLHAKISFYAEHSVGNVVLGRRVVDAFGPDRCMWGGNFPAELWHPKLTYGEHLAVLRDQICQGPAERQAILESTPLRVWFS